MKFGFPTIPNADNVAEPWAKTLLYTLKNVVEDLGTIFNKGVRFDEHVYGGISTVPVVAGTYPVKFAVKTKEVKAVWVGKVFRKSSSTAAPTAGVWCDWEFSGNSISVSNITGLTTGAQYDITFVYLGG